MTPGRVTMLQWMATKLWIYGQLKLVSENYIKKLIKGQKLGEDGVLGEELVGGTGA